MRFRVLLSFAWVLGVWVVFSFFEALGSTNGLPVTTDFVHNLRSDSVVIVVIVVVMLAVTLTRDHQARERLGHPTRQAWESVDAEQAVVLNTPFAHAFEATLGAVRSAPGIRAAKGNPSTGRITAKEGMSRGSWGEHIRIDLDRISDEQTRVTIQSRPAFAPTFSDNGKNATNVSRILYELGRSLPPSNMPNSEPHGSEQARLDSYDRPRTTGAAAGSPAIPGWGARETVSRCCGEVARSERPRAPSTPPDRWRPCTR